MVRAQEAIARQDAALAAAEEASQAAAATVRNTFSMLEKQHLALGIARDKTEAARMALEVRGGELQAALGKKAGEMADTVFRMKQVRAEELAVGSTATTVVTLYVNLRKRHRWEEARQGVQRDLWVACCSMMAAGTR